MQQAPTTPLILNQFSPLKRKQLMTWFLEYQHEQQRPYHRAFMRAFAKASQLNVCQRILELQTKVAFTLLNEFGPCFSQRPAFATLVRLVTNRMQG